MGKFFHASSSADLCHRFMLTLMFQLFQPSEIWQVCFKYAVVHSAHCPVQTCFVFCFDVFPLFVYLCGMERLHPDTTPEHKAALLLPYVSSHCVCSLALCISTLTFGQLRHRIVRLSSGVHTPSPGPSPPPSNQNHSHKCSLLPSALFRIMTWSPVWNDTHMNM